MYRDTRKNLPIIAAVAKGIVESLTTQDLDEPIADNGGTVLDFLVHEAKRISAALAAAEPQDMGGR